VLQKGNFLLVEPVMIVGIIYSGRILNEVYY
jgi:hypothetical protein